MLSAAPRASLPLSQKPRSVLVCRDDPSSTVTDDHRRQWQRSKVYDTRVKLAAPASCAVLEAVRPDSNLSRSAVKRREPPPRALVLARAATSPQPAIAAVSFSRARVPPHSQFLTKAAAREPSSASADSPTRTGCSAPRNTYTRTERRRAPCVSAYVRIYVYSDVYGHRSRGH